MSVEKRLKTLGIDTSSIAFYNHPAFVRSEQRDPEFLCTYADFILEKNYDQDYLDHARRVIDTGVQFFDRELRLDGRKGACIDASMVLSRFLEEEGVWNFMVKGALRIEFPAGDRKDPTYFWPITASGNPASAGHVWLVAPPFKIVDVTLAHQPYSRGEDALLTQPVVVEAAPSSTYGVHDLVEPEVRAYYMMRLGRPMRMSDILQHDPSLQRKIKKYGVLAVNHQRMQLTYIHCGITAPTPGPISEMGNLILRGRRPAQLHEAFKAELSGTE